MFLVPQQYKNIKTEKIFDLFNAISYAAKDTFDNISVVRT